MPERLDLTTLRGLCLAVELGSLGRAAEALGISQPALSKRVRELEADSGAALLRRSTRGVSPTAAGERLYRESRALVTQAEAVSGLLDDLRGTRTPVRLAASHTIAEFLLAAPLAAHRDRPGHRVAVELVSANSGVVRDLVRERQADLGLAAAARAPSASSELTETPLGDDEIVVAVPGGHPWSDRTSIALEEFLPVAMVMRDPGSDSRHVLADALRERGVTASPPLVEVGSTAAAIAAAIARQAPAVLSRHAIDATATLRAVAIEGLPLPRRFVVVRRADAPDAPAVTDLVTLLRTSIPTSG